MKLAPSRLIVVLLVVFLLGGVSVRAAEPHPTLKPLAFMAGAWLHDQGGEVWEETWSAPTGDSMTGMTKQLKDGRTALYEMQAIEVGDDGKPVLLIRHFNAGLTPWGPEREGDATFTMSVFDVQRDDNGNIQSGQIAFSRMDQRSNLPQRILYDFSDPDTFRLTVEHGNNDDPNAWFADVTLTFHRVEP